MTSHLEVLRKMRETTAINPAANRPYFTQRLAALDAAIAALSAAPGSFDTEEALADWLESLHVMLPDRSITADKCPAAQRAARAIREGDSGAQAIRLALADGWNWDGSAWVRPPRSPGRWECFRDASYYDMWCVREVGSNEFGSGFHVPSQPEAEALVTLLSAAPSPQRPATINTNEIDSKLVGAEPQQDGGAVACRINGYMHNQRAVEVILDGPVPAWITSAPNATAYLSTTPPASSAPGDGGGRGARC